MTPGRVFIQMSGAPGAGKSTISRALSALYGAEILDVDEIKTGLLEAGVPFADAGAEAYRHLWQAVEKRLRETHMLIVDSPCFYPAILETGRALAERAGALYGYVECRNDDLAEIDRRLRARPQRLSQRRSMSDPPAGAPPDRVTGEELFRHWIANMVRPDTGFLVLDTSRPVEVCVGEARTYIDELGARDSTL